jgi:transcriptional regulator, ArsR family
MTNLVKMLKALSDETRLRIINLVNDQELCVCDIMEVLSISQTKASRHLGVLRNAGLVNDRKNAQWSYYSMKSSLLTDLINCLINTILREHSIYNEDLQKLEEWLKSKHNNCN